MKIKAIKLQEVLGEDAGMATNCLPKETKKIKEDEEYGYYYPYSDTGNQ